ncbi:DUF116 domain-containing protein [Clostridiaceae bacterium M8S5]|nr:DUF116 domain-containing protein [Clostridiaceae bacterium M8S5]
MLENNIYSLCGYGNNSNNYYNNISSFTDIVTQRLQKSGSFYIKGFKSYLSDNNLESLRSDEEYLLELLVIGVLWNIYLKRAIALNNTPKFILSRLASSRENETLKKFADYFRSKLLSTFLSKENNIKSKFSIEEFSKLIGWLTASGEFKQEVKRISRWKDYCLHKTNNEVSSILKTAHNLATWFELQSDKILGCYTKNVEQFHKGVYKNYKLREDYIFCGRKRVEYHLNMVGAEIMNRAYRDSFQLSEVKLLFLPACMKKSKNCKAKKTNKGYVCLHCSNHCNISKYTQLGKKQHFQVYMIPHESSIFKDSNSDNSSIGIIGVACVLNLISGGWKAKDMGFIPQCVLLDYCGCKHWLANDIETDINMDRLLYILGKK